MLSPASKLFIISKDEQFSPDFLRISPNNKIPAIVDPQGPHGKPVSIFESGAILLYLGEKTGKFLPEPLADSTRDYARKAFERAPSMKKVLADLNIVERRRPQDGQFSVVVDDRPIDIRASVVATVHGEKIVLRLLDKLRSLISLSGLGDDWSEAVDIVPPTSEKLDLDSCGYTSLVPLGSDSFLITYSWFQKPDANGAPRKTVLSRRVRIAVRPPAARK